jgi:hypothetical protein
MVGKRNELSKGTWYHQCGQPHTHSNMVDEECGGCVTVVLGTGRNNQYRSYNHIHYYNVLLVPVDFGSYRSVKLNTVRK